MREILFKAKRKDNNEWVQGNLIYDNVSDKYWIDLSISEDETNSNKLYVCVVEVIPETISQYTGLDDKNGNKIFDNDIIRAVNTFCYSDEDIEGQVYFLLYDGLELKTKDGEIYHFDYLEEIEVIGNKFDNPGLLDKEDN